MADRHVLIAGGGLGGLALAQGLLRAGIQCTVFERDVSPTGREQGYHIGLNPDGGAALRSLAGSEDLEVVLNAEGAHIDTFALINGQSLSPMLSFKGIGPIVDRCRLRHALTLGLEDHIQWNKRFQSYEELPNGKVRVNFEDGTQVEGDVLVGADGARSGVRKQRCPELAYDSVNVVNITGTLRLPERAEIPNLRAAMDQNMVRLFGRTGPTVLLFGFRRTDGSEHMWWNITMPTPGPEEPQVPAGGDDMRAFAMRVLSEGGFHQEMLRVVEMTSIFEDARDLHCIQPTKGNPLGQATRVTLLGDSAHAMTTHAGLGANTAFQDAADLAQALQAADLQASLAAYEAAMIKRGFKNVETSRKMTGMITMKGGGAAVRNAGMRVVGFFVGLKRRMFG